MILIAGQIIETLKATPYPIPATVRKFYSTDKVVAPLIAVFENPSNEGVYIENQPTIVQNVITIEIYAKQATVNGTVMNQNDLAMQLAMISDNALNQTLGLTLTGQAVPAPYSDPSICRIPLRYIAYIDTRKENDNILRGL